MSTTPADPVAAADALAPRIAQLADQIESDRGLPADLVEELARAGLLQLLVRASLGAPGADPVTTCQAIERLARADASTAWCAMVSSTTAYLTGWLPAGVAREMFGDPVDVRISGSSRPLGVARPVEGGYSVSGRWDFASGIGHADWLMAASTVDGENPRVMFVPASQAQVVDTWTTMGMRGTGSHDVVLTDVFVPHDRAVWFLDEPDESLPLLDPRMLRIATHAPAVAVAFGAARAAIDAFEDLAAAAATTSSPVALRDRTDVQIAVARAEAALEGARQLFYSTIGEAWQRVVSGSSDTREAVARARLAMATGGDAALTAAVVVLHAAGTTGIFSRHGIERQVRDLHVIRQFTAFKIDNVVGAGRVLLGLEPEGMGW